MLDRGGKKLNWWIVIPVLASQTSHPQSTQILNEDQNVLQRAQLDPVFVTNAAGEIMKWCHPPSSQTLPPLKRFRENLTSFCEEPKQLLLVAGF